MGKHQTTINKAALNLDFTKIEKIKNQWVLTIDMGNKPDANGAETNPYAHFNQFDISGYTSIDENGNQIKIDKVVLCNVPKKIQKHISFDYYDKTKALEVEFRDNQSEAFFFLSTKSPIRLIDQNEDLIAVEIHEKFGENKFSKRAKLQLTDVILAINAEDYMGDIHISNHYHFKGKPSVHSHFNFDSYTGSLYLYDEKSKLTANKVYDSTIHVNEEYYAMTDLEYNVDHSEEVMIDFNGRHFLITGKEFIGGRIMSTAVDYYKISMDMLNSTAIITADIVLNNTLFTTKASYEQYDCKYYTSGENLQPTDAQYTMIHKGAIELGAAIYNFADTILFAGDVTLHPGEIKNSANVTFQKKPKLPTQELNFKVLSKDK